MAALLYPSTELPTATPRLSYKSHQLKHHEYEYFLNSIEPFGTIPIYIVLIFMEMKEMNTVRQNIYELGDIVSLAAGGPDMTINDVMTGTYDRFNGRYRAQWFAGKKLDSGVFPEESLELVRKVGSAK